MTADQLNWDEEEEEEEEMVTTSDSDDIPEFIESDSDAKLVTPPKAIKEETSLSSGSIASAD
jgi:hypothetical protein